jgi:hypothetical protein
MAIEWKSAPPTDCPFEPSRDLRGIAFTGRHAEYTRADTWYPMWAADDICYSGWTDGFFSLQHGQPYDLSRMDCSSDSRNATNAKRAGHSGTGNARILGDDPLHLTVENLGIEYARAAPYGGRYPCGTLVHDGVWYYGTYTLDETDRGLNWDVLGPFVGFRLSHDLGRSWQECPHTPDHPIFGETGKHGGKVKLGAPHFVDFGRAMQHSPDGKAYMVGHGASRPEAEAAWIRGDQAHLIRCMPSPQTMNDPAAWEFFAGHDASGQPVWTHEFAQIRPLIEWEGRIGHATITYNAPLRKYLFCVTDGGTTISTFNTFILESDSLTGPYRLVTFMQEFGTQAYFVNLPTRFISPDGRTLWMVYSANFSNQDGLTYRTNWQDNPPGSQYAMCLQEIRLL